MGRFANAWPHRKELETIKQKLEAIYAFKLDRSLRHAAITN